MAEVVEVRCPVGPRRLFSKLTVGEESGGYIHPDNVIEVSCSDCSRRLSREQDQPLRVLHRFNFAGELVSTAVEQRIRSTVQR